MKPELPLLAHCLALAEKKLGWEDSQHWTHTDFKALSEKILADTGVRLSPSTLKRLWGRVEYNSTPQAATLNTLARFVGSPDYRAFERANQQEPELTSTTSSSPSYNTPKEGTIQKRFLTNSGLWSIGLGMGFFLSLLLAFSVSQQHSGSQVVNPIQYTFSSRPVSRGIPNSVVFTFDVSQSPTDCLQIQQSWDENLRFSIQKDQHQATSIYYYPGFFRSKLLVDTVVVEEHALYIQTEDWLPLVEQKPVPVYFTPEEGIRKGALGLSVEQLRDRNIPLQPETPWVSYHYVQEMGELSGNNFSLETSMKNTFSMGSGACQQSQLIVLCENSVIAVPLSIPGCTSAINAYIAGESLEGSETDLSALGVDFTHWVNLRLVVTNKTAQVLINGESVLQRAFSTDAGKIVGLVYRFQGTGSVDYLRLYDDKGNLQFKEEFSNDRLAEEKSDGEKL